MHAGLFVPRLVVVSAATIFLSPTPQQLTGVEQDLATPCYYFCGPWYTWMVTLLAGIFVLAVVIVWVAGHTDVVGEQGGDPQ